MAERTVKCARLKKELPGIDPDTPEGEQALKMALLCGGPELQRKLRDGVSQEA